MCMFKKAIRSQTRIKIGITGPTGSGKTYSALRLASGLGKKIAVIDSENGSASLYSDKFEFDVVEIKPPYTTEKYEAAIDQAVKLKYDVLVIDSTSHAWMGEGGLLEQKEALDRRPGTNHWTNWAPITKKQNQFMGKILHSDINIISTMRSKMEYVQNDSGGKKKIEKAGLAPQQRDGVEYEYSIVFELAMNNEAEAGKDRTGLFFGKIFKITEDTGEIIKQWLNSSVPSSPSEEVKQKVNIKTETTPLPEQHDGPELDTEKLPPDLDDSPIDSYPKSAEESILDYLPSVKEVVKKQKQASLEDYKLQTGQGKGKRLSEAPEHFRARYKDWLFKQKLSLNEAQNDDYEALCQYDALYGNDAEKTRPDLA